MALRELIAEFDFSFNHADLKKGHDEIERLKEMTSRIAETVVEAFAVREIVSFVKETIESAAALGVQAKQLGLNVEGLQLLDEAAAETGGSVEGLNSSLRILSVHAQNAKEKGGEAASEFTKLGISAAELKSLGPQDLFLRTGNAIAGIADPTERAAKAVAFFGRGGLQNMALFGKGAGEATKLLEELKEAGGGFDEDFVESAHEAEAAGKRFDFVLTRLKNNALKQLVPIVEWLTHKLSDFVSSVNKATDGTHVWEAALTVLGALGIALAARMILAWLPVIAPFLLWAAVIGAVILVLDDIFTLMTGGDSLIGRFIDSMFGVGASKTFVEDLKIAWDALIFALQGDVEIAKAVFGALIVALQTVWEGWAVILDGISKLWATVFAALPQPVKDALDWVRGEFAALFNWISDKAAALNPFSGILDAAFKKSDEAANAVARAHAAAPPVGGGTVSQSVPVPARGGGSTVHQETGGIVVNVDARGAKEPGKVGSAAGQGALGALRSERRAAMNALDHRGAE